MDTSRAPLYERLVQHYESGSTSFHVPGHKTGNGNFEASAFLRAIMQIDYTEITGLDDLHDPNGVIDEAQRLAAFCFGAEETAFLVGGSTVGNLALILALCKRGETLIVQRNVHKSIINGLRLAGAKAVFLSPRWDERSGLASGCDAAQLEQALRQYPEAKAVLLTNPNYYGMGVDLAPLAQIAHRYGKPLVVDEAHGAHFGFHPALPASALSCGADAVVQSTHKMLTAMTMGAMLHMQGTLINRTEVKQKLAMLQSSSPSYPIMASLDLSRRLLHVNGAKLLEQGLEVVAYFRKRMKELPSFEVIDLDGGNKTEARGFDTFDPFKVTIREAIGGLSGFELQHELERLGCMMEMADSLHVLAVFSLASSRADADRLFRAFSEIASAKKLTDKHEPVQNLLAYKPLAWPNSISAPISFDSDNGQQCNRSVQLAEATGCVSAEMIVPYPPGIPLLYPGEIINVEIVEQLTALARTGARFQGASDSSLQTIKVL